MKQKILLSMLALAVCIGVGAYLKSEAAGWLWGGTDDGTGQTTGIGWVSFSKNNCDPDNDGITEGGTENAEYPNCPSGLPVTDYQVNVPSGDGPLSGYAWSENLGWIDFAPTGPFPEVATGDDYPFAVKREGNFLRGWARIVGIKTEYEKVPVNSGGWQGWIRMSSDSNDPVEYAVDITKMDGTGTKPTYAWSDELGWINFSRAKISNERVLKICSECLDNVSPLNSVTIIKGDNYLAKACLVNSQDTCSGTDVTNLANWSSNKQEVATVNNDTEKGKINSVDIGTAEVKAEYNDGQRIINNSIEVNVIEPVIPNPPTPNNNSIKWREVSP